MSTYFRTPHILKKGPLYKVIESNCTIVIVMGYGNSLSNILLMTLLLELITYHKTHKNSTVNTSLVCLRSAMLAQCTDAMAVRMKVVRILQPIKTKARK